MAGELKPLDVLREDHKVVLKKLDVMDGAIRNLDSNPASLQALKDLIPFFTGEVVVHFAKEEEAVFPEIEKFIPREGGPTGMMLIEHEDLNNAKANFIKGVEGLTANANSQDAKKLITDNGGHFVSLLRDHIYKEDNILFMMAEMHMDETQVQAVAMKFAEIDKRYLADKK